MSTAVTAEDSVGQAPAALRNMAASAWVSGRQYTALALDGVDDDLLCAADLAPVMGGTASLSFWARTTQAGTDAAGTAPGLLGSAGIQWAWLDGAGRVGLSVDGQLVARSSEAVNDGEWHHLVLTRDAATGAVEIYVDGGLTGSGTGPAGTRAGSITRLGAMDNGSPARLAGRIDQIHLFTGVVDAATRGALRKNHAPKTWPVTTEGESGAAFQTASVLVNTYAYDAEQNPLSVVSFTQPANGAVVAQEGGTFTYTPSAGFTGGDLFTVRITDGRGGFTTSTVRVVVKPADPAANKFTVSFTDFQGLSAGGTAISLSDMRVPRALDWDADGDTDLLIGHSSGVWFYRNTGTVSAPVFAAGTRVQAGGANLAGGPIAFVDMTGDGIGDLLVVDSNRQVRVCRNTAAAGAAPVLAAPVSAVSTKGGSFVLPDNRFDAADWNGDGLTDLVNGHRDGPVQVYLNEGTPAAARFNPDVSLQLESGSYNLYPRVVDLNRDGTRDLVRGINWGAMDYWLNPPSSSGLPGSNGSLILTNAGGGDVDIKPVTDGAIPDFADFNGDGALDLIAGGHAGTQVSLAYGLVRTVADSLAEMEAIYDAHPSDLGTALEADGQALLQRINAASRNIISRMNSSLLTQRQADFTRIAAHIGKYPFLKLGAALDTAALHHVPSIAGQNLMTLHRMLPDSPAHRLAVADATGLTGKRRTLYLESSLHVGDNQRGSEAQIQAMIDFFRLQPYESFPDAMVTLDNYWGDGRGGHVSSFRGAKNTFTDAAGRNVSEWAGDLNTAVEAFFGSPVQKGDYFTFVLGHEVTHSLDGYLTTRANRDLWRRKGQMLTLAGGPGVVSTDGSDHDWWNQDATKTRFRELGYWDGTEDWNTAWERYWASGPGAAFESLSFMRGDIDSFMVTPQEAMATQANHHWAHAEGRIIGAIDRWKRGVASNVEPMKANLTEVIDFLDMISCGMNQIVMQDTEGQSSQAVFRTERAWVERDDAGRITRVAMDNGRTYRFAVDEYGIVTGILAAPVKAAPDTVDVVRDAAQLVFPLRNDTPLAAGSSLEITSFTQPANGSVTDEGGGMLLYTPNTGYTGTDSFTYNSGGNTATVRLRVRPPAASESGLTLDTWNSLTGQDLETLTNDPDYPAFPDASVLNATAAVPTNRGSSFGSRLAGLLIPPVSGDYTFWIAGDEVCQLWLGTDRSAGSRSLAARLDEPSPAQEWTRYPSQQSAVIPLEAGRAYYFEALQKESWFSDHLAVAWQGPDLTRQVIGSSALKTFDYHAPVVALPLPDVTLPAGSAARTVDLAGVFTDADLGDKITLMLRPQSNPDAADVTLNAGTRQLTITPRPGRSGTSEITLWGVDFTEGVAMERFTLTVEPPADPDQDDDGIPDVWETAHGLNPQVPDATDDDDADGWTNGEEYTTGTDPQSAASRQSLTISPPGDAGQVRLSFPTAAGREYQIEHSPDLEAGLWQALGTARSGTGEEAFTDDPAPPAGGRRFYRLRVRVL